MSVSLGEAFDYVFGLGDALDPVEIGLADALGLVVAADVHAREAVPPFANTAMDGYAVRAADTLAAPVELRVVGMLAAGAAPTTPVGDGEALRIMTGAPMPPGADAVVMVERTSTSADGGTVTIEVSVPVGEAVRPVGDDVRPGDLVVAAGDVLTPGRLGVLASVGVDRLSVRPRPRVGVLSTGDELVEGSAPLEPGQIRESNRPALRALVAQSGFDVIDLGIARDNEPDVTAAIERAVAECDVVLTSGGVSMGDLDYVKVVLDRIGEMRWMQIDIKPAKPLAAGVVKGVPVVGLPGNPVSSMVSFELFARPLLRKMAGHTQVQRPEVPATAEHDFRRGADGKTHFVRVVATMAQDGTWSVRSAGGQGSHQLAGMASANALAVLPDGPGITAGEPVRAMLLSWP